MERTFPIKSQVYQYQIDERKSLPESWEKPVRYALSFFPELKSVHIRFIEKPKIKPYSCNPDFKSFFKKPGSRTFQILLSTKTTDEFEPLLMENLDFDSQVGVIGHLLAHLIQLRDLSRNKLAKTYAHYPFPRFRTHFEQEADKIAIEHGLGWELYKWTVHLGKFENESAVIKYLNQFHLTPEDILHYMQNLNKNKFPELNLNMRFSLN